MPAIEHVVCIPVSPPGSVEPYRKSNKACDNPGLTTHLRIQTCSLLHAAVLLSVFPTYAHDIPGYTWYKYIYIYIHTSCIPLLQGVFSNRHLGHPYFWTKMPMRYIDTDQHLGLIAAALWQVATFSRDGLRRSQSRTSPSALEQKMPKKHHTLW